MNTSIHESETIVNSLKEKNLYELFSAHVIKHLITILIAVFSIGYHGKQWILQITVNVTAQHWDIS